MRSKPTREVIDCFRNVFGFREIDEMLCSGLHDKVFLASRINANDPEADAAGGDLRSEVTQSCRAWSMKDRKAFGKRFVKLTTAGTEQNDPVSALGV